MLESNNMETKLPLVLVLFLAAASDWPQTQGADLYREPKPDRERCIKETANYVAKATIEKPVWTLIEKSREFYPNVLRLIQEEIPTEEYIAALRKIDSQYGCAAIQEHIQKIAKEVTCYHEFQLDADEFGTRDVAQDSQAAGEVFEAFFVCQTAGGR